VARAGRAWETGKRTRTVTCSFCGQEHRRRSKELADCRARARKGLPPVQPPPPSAKRAHLIAKELRAGKPHRKIAKHFGVPVDEVRDVAKRIGRNTP
jgi:hypothetical protein